MIFVVGAEKGGVGKSAYTANLAVKFAAAGHRTLVVDTDSTASTVRWHQRRVANGIEPEISCIGDYVKPVRTIIEMSGTYDVVLVDMGARDYDKMSELAKVADLWLAPLQAGVADLDSSKALYDAFRRVGSQHKSGRIPLVFSLNRLSASKGEEMEAREALAAACPDAPVLIAGTRDRKVWRDATKIGMSIYEMPKRDSQKAVEEFDAVIEEALSHRVA